MSFSIALNSMTQSSQRFLILIILGFLLAAFVVVPYGLVFAQEGDSPPQPEPVGKAYRGKTLFLQRCASCHGENGDGNSPLADQLPGLPDFTAPDYTQGKTPQELFDVITNGRMDKMMPPWGNELSEGERWDLVAYIWSLHYSPHQLANIQGLYEQTCASCHGSSGTGVAEGAPDLHNPKWLAATDDEIIAAFTSEAHPSIPDLKEEDLPLLASAARRFSLGFDETQVTIEGTGDVEILVKNGTTGEILPHQPVRLLIFQQEQFQDMREGETDEQGRVQFTGLPTNPTWAYIAETTYQDLPYHSDVGQFSPDTNMIELTVSVYDPGATRDAISIDRAHWLVDITTPGFVDVGEVYVFANSADRVYAGERPDPNAPPRVLEIPLPDNAIGINVEGQAFGDRFQLDGTTVIDTQPLPPGTMQLFVRYALPVEDGQVIISHPLPYYTRMLNLLAPDIGIQVDAPDWQEDEPIATQGGNFLNYTIFDLPAGATPRAVISGITEKMAQSAQDASSQPREVVDHGAAPGVSGFPHFPWVVLGMGIVVLAGAVALGWHKHRQVQAEAPILREEQKQALAAQIAALDEAFEAGEIPRDQYDEQRNLLKLQLIALLREERESDEDKEGLNQLDQTPKIHPEEDASQPATEVSEESQDDAAD